MIWGQSGEYGQNVTHNINLEVGDKTSGSRGVDFGQIQFHDLLLPSRDFENVEDRNAMLESRGDLSCDWECWNEA